MVWFIFFFFFWGGIEIFNCFDMYVVFLCVICLFYWLFWQPFTLYCSFLMECRGKKSLLEMEITLFLLTVCYPCADILYCLPQDPYATTKSHWFITKMDSAQFCHINSHGVLSCNPWFSFISHLQTVTQLNLYLLNFIIVVAS